MRVAPLMPADQLRELALEVGHIFLGEMHALHGDGEQIHGKDCCGIVLPGGCNPDQIGNDQACAEENDRTAHPASLRRHYEQHEDAPDDAIPRSRRICPIHHAAAASRPGL